MILYLDTETTGLRPGNICQLSYIMQDSVGQIGKNFFFTVDFVEKSAESVHGFSVRKLIELSNGKRFDYFFPEIKKDFDKASVVCAHNSSFDFMFLRKEFENSGEVFDVKNPLCTMKFFTSTCKLTRSGGGYKYPKLSELCAHFGILDFEIQDCVREIYNEDLDFHDARFDTCALFLAVNKAIKSEPKAFGLREYLDL